MLAGRSLKILRVAAILTVTLLILPSSCEDPIGSPESRLFTGRTEGFRISFEYPDTWRRDEVYKYDAYRVISLYSSGLTVSVSSDVTANNGGDFADASELIQTHAGYDSWRPEFQIISRSKTQLGQVEWEEVIYSCRFIHNLDPHLPPNTVVDYIGINRSLATDHQGRIYGINLIADVDSYQEVREGFEHLIATFRFLD
jgi:hypothetical protein